MATTDLHSPIQPTHPTEERTTGELKKDSLGTAESIVMGIAGTAPAYSIEATAFTLIGITALFSPSSILVSGLIMFGIAWAFIHLNRYDANAGTSFAWVSKIFGRTAGFFAGWALLVVCCIFMVSATIPAANAILMVVAPQLVNDVSWVTGLAILIMTLISAIVVKGIKMTSTVQIVLTVIEAIILVAILWMGYAYFSQHPAHQFSWSWFNPFNLSPGNFVEGALISIFFYYGWDVSMNLAEETKDPANTPGRATFWSIIFLILFFIIFIVLILLAMSMKDIAHYNTNILYAITEKLMGKTWANIAIIAVLLSTVGTIETQILQFTRTLFAKSRSGVIPQRFGQIHSKWQTPYVAIFIIWLVSVTLIILYSYKASVNAILESSISAIGYQISFYLSLTAFACAWLYRKTLKDDFKASLTKVIWPTLSGVFLVFVLVYSVFHADAMTNAIGLGGIIIGIIPYMLSMRRKGFN